VAGARLLEAFERAHPRVFRERGRTGPGGVLHDVESVGEHARAILPEAADEWTLPMRRVERLRDRALHGEESRGEPQRLLRDPRRGGELERARGACRERLGAGLNVGADHRPWPRP
jgi:hypothetical protein